MDGYQYKKSEKGIFLPIIDEKNGNYLNTLGLV